MTNRAKSSDLLSAKTMAEAFDLASLDTAEACNTGTQIELRHPEKGTGLGLFIGVVGKDSDVFRSRIAASVNRARIKAQVAARRGRPADVTTLEEDTAENIELLVACTTGFWHLKDGEKVPGLIFGGVLDFTPANATKLYNERIFVREQVNDAIGDLSNFMTV